MANVAFFIYGIGSLKGGGGAERFFADLFDKYQSFEEKKHKLFYIIDNKSVINLNDVGKLNYKKNILYFKIFSNRFKNSLEALELIFFIFLRKINIIHIPLYNNSYIPLLQIINKLPEFIRPRIVINIVNCYVAQALSSKNHIQHESMKKTYLPLFNEIEIDGYFCWNKSFKEYVILNDILKFKPKNIYAINSRFSDVSKFYPEMNKKKWVVFASRLDEQKHPDWLLKAILILKNNNPELINGWKFIICGDGPMRKELIDFSIKNGLNEIVDFKIEGEIQKILNYSLIYVSCQDFDNFPSLSMSEAMASGNAIIARNVGQTELFLKNNINGLYIVNDNIDGLVSSLMILLCDINLLKDMGKNSSVLIRDVHSFENFVPQIESFWQSIN